MKKEVKKSPFFAQLLEKQIKNDENVHGGADQGAGGGQTTDILNVDWFTKKYPSDGDDTTPGSGLWFDDPIKK